MPIYIRIGLTIDEFWSCSISELNFYKKAHEDKEKARAEEIAATNYMLSSMIAAFVGSVLGGKKIPSFESMYPTTIKNKNVNNNGKPVMDAEALRIKAQLTEFAINHNRQMKGGGK